MFSTEKLFDKESKNFSSSSSVLNRSRRSIEPSVNFQKAARLMTSHYKRSRKLDVLPKLNQKLNITDIEQSIRESLLEIRIKDAIKKETFNEASTQSAIKVREGQKSPLQKRKKLSMSSPTSLVNLGKRSDPKFKTRSRFRKPMKTLIKRNEIIHLQTEQMNLTPRKCTLPSTERKLKLPATLRKKRPAILRKREDRGDSPFYVAPGETNSSIVIPHPQTTKNYVFYDRVPGVLPESGVQADLSSQPMKIVIPGPITINTEEGSKSGSIDKFIFK